MLTSELAEKRCLFFSEKYTTEFTYDAKKQRLVEDALNLYWYDQNGNLASKQAKDNSTVVNYIHNSQNQLIGIDFFQGASKVKEARYVYDVIGRRVEKKVVDLVDSNKSFIRHYTYDGNEMLAELDSDNQLLALYTQSGMRTDDTLAVQITSDGAAQGLAVVSGSYQFIKDGLGSITSITNSTGDVLQKYIYSGFGILAKVTDVNDLDITSNPTLNPYFTFANREFDKESGLYFLRARFYAPELGRFIQSDPDPGSILTPITMINKYSYVANNPQNLTDPTGMSFLKQLRDIGIGFALGGIHGIVGAINVSGNFSDNDKMRVNIIYASMAAGGVSGAAVGSYVGTAAASSGAFSATVLGIGAGAVTGALTGGVTGGFTSLLQGGDFGSGFKLGALAGGIAGGIAGGATAGYAFEIQTYANQAGLFDTLGCGVASGAFAFGGLGALGGAAAIYATAAAPFTGGLSYVIWGAAVVSGSLLGGSASYLVGTGCI